MEIYSFRSSTNFLFKGNSRNTKSPEVPAFEEKSPAESFADVKRKAGAADFTRISPRELRSLAGEYYRAGQIGPETFFELSQELPAETLTATGDIVDISHVTEDTAFNFTRYFEDRWAIARSVGSPADAEKLRTVLSFLASA